MPTPSNPSSTDSPAENEQPQNAASPPSEAQPGQPPTQSDASGANSSPEGQQQPPRGLYGSGLRYEDTPDIPDFLRGKTAKEAAAITKQLYDTLMSEGQQRQPQQELPSTHAPQASMPQPQNGAPALPSPDLMYSDPAEYQRQYDAYNTARMQSLLQQSSQPFLASQAQMARNAAKSDPERSDVWGKYAAEIDMEMSRVALEQRASVDAWNMAADLVAGRHRRELAQEWAERRPAQHDTGLTQTDGAPGAPAPQSTLDPIAQLFRDDHPAIQRFREQGISAEALKAKLPVMGHTPESYAKLITKHGASISYSERKDGRTVNA